MTLFNESLIDRSKPARNRLRKGRSFELVRLPHFDWDKAKYFYYIAKFGSFAEAAKFLNISQSGLSRKIALLEEHIKFPLLRRLSRGVEFTPKGEELFAIVERTFMEMKEFVHNTVSEIDTSRTVIRVASTAPVAAYLLNDHLVNFCHENPHVAFEVVGEDRISNASVGVANVDFVIRPYDVRESDWIQEPLINLEKKLFASPSYLEEFGTPQTPEDLVNHRIIGPCLNSRIEYPFADIFWIYRLGLPRGRMHRPIYSSNSIECMVDAACRGLGIIATYDSMSIVQNSDLQPILPGIVHIEQPLHISYAPYIKKDTELQKFVAHLQRAFAPKKQSYD